MKKKVIHFVQYALIKILFFGAVYPLHAQVSNPSSWESFVGSDENRLVSDTFRLQTFGDSERDNWGYTLTANSSLIQEKHTIKIPVGSGIIFSPFSLNNYTNVKIVSHIAGLKLEPGELLLFNVHRNNSDEVITGNTPEQGKDYMGYRYLTIGSNPSSFTITTDKRVNTQDGYYMTDNVFAYGDIPSYSLFSGIGNWNDTTLWSHLPPLRHRNALIKGNVTITTDTYCKDIAIHSGSLEINPGNLFILQNLDLYENKASLHSGGTILLSGRITFHKTFEEPGKWYFISFPFDVYPPGIDLHFEQKDATPNDGGNYFYVQSYNGDKRASSNQSAGNWEVVPIRPDNVPLFEKNKGYLIALDEKTTNRTLSFSSRPGDIPEDFANTGVITIPSSPSMISGNQENYGWYLCGNPFPAPLVLSQIEKNEALDGNIYVYDGSGYKTYSLNSNYALPPFAAFFVKAFSPTELKVPSNSTPTKAINIIPTNFPMSKNITEPHPDKQSTEIKPPNTEEVHFFIKDGQLHLQNLPEAGYIKIFNMMGHCIFQKRIRHGSQVVPMIGRSGVYLLTINTGNTKKISKIIL
ncbi:T9SS type A sorting domain-containing protein [Parabacteroides johnsonii]|uniref:T9SS type A sorting domain-containing protein n=1 Tax=Parabacteroides johnsonii TaxID=387661 RepID=UPI0011DCE98F|nr:T9SS type A sorting domain-containing protein [Parabacteroides johnsonii]